jgi:phosphoribosylformylglycinamidine synthase
VPPVLDLEGEKRLHSVLLESIAEGMLASCHDVSDGGIAVCLAESCILSEIGALVLINKSDFPTEHPASALLFGEAQGRAIVTVRTEKQFTKLTARASRCGVRAIWLGTVGGTHLRIAVGSDTLVEEPVDELAALSANAIPRRMSAASVSLES